MVTEKAARSSWEDMHDPTEDVREPTILKDFSPPPPHGRGSWLLKEEDRQISGFQYLETDKST